MSHFLSVYSNGYRGQGSNLSSQDDMAHRVSTRCLACEDRSTTPACFHRLDCTKLLNRWEWELSNTDSAMDMQGGTVETCRRAKSAVPGSATIVALDISLDSAWRERRMLYLLTQYAKGPSPIPSVAIDVVWSAAAWWQVARSSRLHIEPRV